jgi:hypothetical protein
MKYQLTGLFFSTLLLANGASSPHVHAALGDCSQPVSSGATPTASDCLFILQAAVGSLTCTTSCVCDPTGGGGITATDALTCLANAVGQDVALNCPCGDTTTTSSTILTTTTTLDTTTTTTGGSTTTTTILSTCLVDTGLTVIDTCNELEWEKKDTAVGSGVDAGNLHDVDNRYAWAGRCSLDTGVLCQPNTEAAATCAARSGGAVGCTACGASEGGCELPLGAITTIWDWLNQINIASFAGHSDWRLATVAGSFSAQTGEPAELESIYDPGSCGGGGGACINPVFGPTISGLTGSYWSASTSPANANAAFAVEFTDGEVQGTGKAFAASVRAVRSPAPTP